MSVPNMINILEKINLITSNNCIDYNLLENVSYNIILNDMSKYIELCKRDNLKEARDHILNMCKEWFFSNRYFRRIFLYIKFHSNLDDNYKYEIIKLICKYINIFHNIHEDSIELIFLTNNLRNIFNKNII